VDNKKLRFDGWMLDAESGDLERAGTRTRLPEQPTLVLKELIRHAGHVVTREHLIGVLWPEGVVDFDTGLNTAIRKLRSALGDVAETPRYIETLPRRGYRFIAALDADPDEAAAERSAAMPGPTGAAGTQPSASPEVAAAEPGRRHGTGLLPWLSIGGALLAAAAAALWFTLGTDHAARNPLADVTLTRLTDWSGTEQAALVLVGFTRALDQHQTRALLHPIKDDCGTVRRNVEIANHEVCGQIGQLVLGSSLRVQCPKILAIDPAAKKHQCSGVARECNPTRAECQDETRHVVRSAVGSGGSQRKSGSHLCAGIDEILAVR
jgi:DNA-binding winged helix-turn-helix (wHTH) protein